MIPLFDYERHRIIMESSFTFQGKTFLYFPDGVKYYSLYRTKRKINSFSELEYIAEKFLYLNPGFNIDLMKSLFQHLSDRDSGHIIRTYSDTRVNYMIDQVAAKKSVPFCPRLRKIIFNPTKMLDRQEKMRIVGSVINTKEKPEADDISAVIEELWLNKEKITIGKIASTLNTSRYLISYYFDDEISESIKKLNQEIRDVNLMSKAIEAIDELTDKGNRLKMRQLKKLTSIRDYALLKQAVIQYQNQI